MNYTSTIANMLNNPNHNNYRDIAYSTNHLSYILKDDILFQLIGTWGFDFRNWLENHGIDVGDERRVYTPIGKLEKRQLIGYNTQYPNIANRFLSMGENTRKSHFENLYFVEVGNHPYPKPARYRHSWLVTNYHSECHQIINPPSEPKNFFFPIKSLAP